MTVLSGRVVTLKAGGTSTAMTTEATTDSGDHKVFQITSAAKRAIDPDAAVSVFVSGDEIADALYSVDYAHGVITFEDEYGGESAGPVTVTGNFLPLLTIAHCKSAKITGPRPVFADSTQIGDTAPRVTEIAKECSIELVHISKPVYVDDPIYSFDQIYSDSLPVFVEADMSGAGTAGLVLRGWFAVASWTRDSPTDGVGTSSISLRGVCRTCVGRPTTDQAIFSVR